MNAHDRIERVAALTSAWIDGRATTAELRELNDLLNGDPEACERYLDVVEIHAALVHEHAGDTAIPLPAEVLPFSQLSQPPRSGLRRRSRWLVPLAAAALVALSANVALLLWQSSGRDALTADGGVAVLSRAVDPEWPDPASSMAEGAAISAGVFQLRSGLAQIEFFSGATVIVEGPAKLEIESAWRVVCRSGRLRASVPEPARGFTIVAPDYEAVDLGTEFALSVDSGGRSEIHVVDGEVRLDDSSGRDLRHLAAGAAVRSIDGSLTTIESRGDTFVDRQQLMRLAQNDWRSRYASWDDQSQKLRADPAALAYFDFEDQDPWDRALPSRASESGGELAGAIIGAQWTQGRWPGKGALEFKRISDRVRIRVPGDHSALTLSAWVRIEGFERWLSSIILADGWEPGEVHWQISDKGEMILGVSGWENAFSPPVIQPSDLGRWLHLAVTVDTAAGHIVHYVDGEPVMEKTDIKATTIPLRIGDAEIGNWQSQGRGHAIRSLNGRIDEFGIFARAFTAGEIRALHTAGMPNG